MHHAAAASLATLSEAEGTPAGDRARQGSAGRAAPNISFQVLGPLEAWVGARKVEIGGPRQRVVLAMLLLAPDRVVSIDQLVEAVWNGRPPTTCRTQIAICVASLRKAFRTAGYAGELIATSAPGYLLHSAGHHIDSMEFAAGVDSAQTLARQGDVSAAADRLGQALGLWRGPVLTDMSSPVLETEAELLDHRRLTAYEQYATLQLQLGRHREVISELTALVHDRPLWEQARAALMLAHYRLGHRSEALALFRQAQRVFREEIGLEPGRVLQDLHTAILREASDLMPPTDVVGPLNTGVDSPQLPLGAVQFIGREREIQSLDALLRRAREGISSVGLVVGRPGIGKTALVLHWARRATHAFPDGRLYVDFERTGTADAPAALLRALGMSDHEIPRDYQDRLREFHRQVGQLRLLVILDGVPDDSVAHDLVPKAGRCCVLLTSRRVLATSAQVRLRVPELTPADAVTLLGSLVADGRVEEDRAAAHSLASLCDYLPLALSAAAARLVAKPHWRFPHLLTRLCDRRHRLDELSTGAPVLRQVLDSVYRTLSPAAAGLYARLGLVNGECIAVWEAEALLEVSAMVAQRLLEELVDATLLEVADTGPDGWFRYRLPTLHALHAERTAHMEVAAPIRKAACDRVLAASLFHVKYPADSSAIPALHRVD
ncbi:BTAD domain-containing putative transcriptional regulator [Streptomyces sp. NPDC007088]|uniref:AfsR/SARP family transcriptional regulator n=1 Tax=Streptomyces sp. NPDC007088 TaxID=3364773 RepID=UPI00369C63EE